MGAGPGKGGCHLWSFLDLPNRLSWLNPGKGATHHSPPFSAQAQDGALLVDVTKKPGATNLEQSEVRSDDIDLDSQLNLEIAMRCLPFASASQSWLWQRACLLCCISYEQSTRRYETKAERKETDRKTWDISCPMPRMLQKMSYN